MKNNLIILLTLLLIFSGCNKENVEKEENEIKEEIVEEKIEEIVEEPTIPEYTDLNNTPISIYKNNKHEIIS